MAPKRNDPCHCGSGKKYKHCHMKADREAELAEKESALSWPEPDFHIDDMPDDKFSDGVMAETIAPDISEFGKSDLDEEPKEIDPEIERLNELFSDFEDADYEERVTLTRTAIEEKALDSESAFEFFNDLYPVMVERDERARFDELVGLLKSNQPEIYKEENPWFWSWEVPNALVLKDDDALQLATDQLIKNGGQDLDQFYPVFNMLFYHDRRDVLLNSLDKHTIDLSSKDYFPHAEFELNQHIISLIINNYLETHKQSELLDSDNFEALCSALEKYIEDPNEFAPDVLTKFLSLAGGTSVGNWTMADLGLRAKPKLQEDSFWRDDEDEEEDDELDPALANLRDLSCEFFYYARSVENVPRTRVDLIRLKFIEYICERNDGELEPVEKRSPDFRGDRDGFREKKSRKGSKKKSENKKIQHPLLPDHPTMDRYLSRFFGFMVNRTYEGIAFFELLPAWSRFIQSKGLATEEEVQKSLTSLQALSAAMLRVAESHDFDPTLAESMRGWRENARI